MTESPFNQGPAFRGTMTFVASGPDWSGCLAGIDQPAIRVPDHDLAGGRARECGLGHAGGAAFRRWRRMDDQRRTGEPYGWSPERYGSIPRARDRAVESPNRRSSRSRVSPTAPLRIRYPPALRSASRHRARRPPPSPARCGSSLPRAAERPTHLSSSPNTRSGVTVSEASVRAEQPGSAFRVYAEASGSFQEGEVGSIQSGIAIANTSPTPANVTLEAHNAQGEDIRVDGEA